MLPTNKDPNYPNNLSDYSVNRDSLQHVRALPVEAGGVLGWNQYLLHWGSTSNDEATGPRVSIGIYAQSSDVTELDVTTLSCDQTLPLVDRLGIIGRMIIKYKHFCSISDELMEFCSNQAQYFEALQKILKLKQNIPSGHKT